MDFILHILQIILTTSLIIVMVWLADRAVGQRMGRRWRKILWFLLAIRLLFPVKIHISEFTDSFHGLEITVEMSESIHTKSVEKEKPAEGNVRRPAEIANVNVTQNAGNIPAGTEDAAVAEQIVEKHSSVVDIVVLFWVMGVLVMLMLHMYQYRRMKKACFEQSAACEDAGIAEQERRLCRELGIKNPVPVRIVNQGDYYKSPMLIGYLKPVLLLPDVSYKPYELEAILKHELLHYRAKDLWHKLLMVIVCDIYWFNPVFRLMKNMAFLDVECVCDERATQNMDLAARKNYGSTILKTMSGTKETLFASTTQFAGTKKNMKARFNNIFLPHNRKMEIAILCFFSLLFAAGTLGVSLTSSENRRETAVPETVTFEQEITEELETRQLEARPADISADIPCGLGPRLDFAGKPGGEERIIVFHDYFGLFVYDFNNRKVIRSLDLALIGCNALQGDEACQVAVSADGTTVWLHPQTKAYMYRYEIPENLLYQESLVKIFEEDLEGEELFDRYLAADEQPIPEKTGWYSNYLYEEFEDENGIRKAYIYLVFHLSDEDKPWLLTLQCVWDDMVCVLFEDNSGI